MNQSSTLKLFPIDRWEIDFDGATRTNSNEELTSGVGKLFITPEGHMIPHSFSLTESCSNNVAEYQALIMGMEMAHEISIDPLEVCGDSKLIVNQMNGKYEVKKPNFLLYHKKDGSSPRVSVWCSQAGFSQGCLTVRTGIWSSPLVAGLLARIGSVPFRPSSW